jgi:large subunit ribosomal protein L17
MARRKLGRKTAFRMALLRNLTTDLLRHEKIITTVPKAKEVRRLVERMISLGKRGRAATLQASQEAPEEERTARQAESVHVRRQALAFVFSKRVVDKTFDELAQRYAERPGGYTRSVNLGPRHGDGAPMAQIELVP